MSILSVQDISKSYKLRKIVKSLSLDIKSGEVAGLLGPNGAGKTTAFYMIVGLITADSGKILLDGKDLTALPMHSRAKLGLGYLPHDLCEEGREFLTDYLGEEFTMRVAAVGYKPLYDPESLKPKS